MNLKLPVSKVLIDIREISNKDYMELQKILISSDDVNLIFDNLILKCADIDIRTICNIDKLAILLFIRSISIGSAVTLSTDSGINFNVDLEFIISQLSAFDKCNLEEVVGGVNFILTLPRSLRVESKEECIHWINSMNVWSLNTSEYNSILNAVPRDIRKFINEESLNIPQVFLLPSIDSSTLKFGGVQINPLRDLSHIVKYLLTESIDNLFERKYVSIHDIGISASDYDNMSPGEARVYISYFNARENNS